VSSSQLMQDADRVGSFGGYYRHSVVCPPPARGWCAAYAAQPMYPELRAGQ
jgi:hypothetical protein